MEPKITLSEADLEQLRERQDVEIRRGFAQHFADGTTGCAPATLSVDPADYTDPARWEAEKREIFQNSPLLACLTQDIPNSGDMMVFDAAGPSILVVRGRDGLVNAFFNMCTHRMSKLIDECRQGRKSVTCPFHGWTFDLNGKLIGVPREDDFDRDDLATRNLIRVPVGEWAGMIFVIARAGEERIDIEAFLGDAALQLMQLQLEKAGPAASARLDVATNWKYAHETFTEGYHVGTMHPQTVGALYVGGVNVVTHYGKHHEYAFAAHKLPEALKTMAPEARELAGTTARIFQIFPNMSLNCFPVSDTESLVNISRVFPGKSVGEAFSLQTDYKFGGHVTDADREKYVSNHELIKHVISSEDFRVCANAYVNLRHAPPGFKMVFGRNEPITQAMHRNQASATDMPVAQNPVLRQEES